MPTIDRLADFFEHLLQGMRAGDDIPVNEARTDKDSLEAQTVQVTVQIFVGQYPVPILCVSQVAAIIFEPPLRGRSFFILPSSVFSNESRNSS